MFEIFVFISFPQPKTPYFIGFLAVFSIASCEDTWSLFSRTQEEELLLFALTEVDCPRLPTQEAITVTYTEAGQELPQLLLDLRTEHAFKWKSAVILHDETLSEYCFLTYYLVPSLVPKRRSSYSSRTSRWTDQVS